MTEILQKTIPYNPLVSASLPGIKPMDIADWLIRDDAFAGQMRERDQLLATRRDDVLALNKSAFDAANELLTLVLKLLYPNAEDAVLRPDGVRIPINRADPLATLGRLVQDDFCILQKSGDEHVLTGAVLCFPASWMLAEKFMQPLIGIHDPVDSYDADIAKRVQRLFDGVRVGRPMWRCNALWYADPALHQPRTAHNRRDECGAQEATYMRSERQCILRLPETQAVIFSIHTFVLRRQDVMAQWR